MQLSKLMTQNTNRQGVEDLLAKLQKECSNLEGEASSLQQDLADSQTSCEQLQGALAESRWAAALHARGVLCAALLVLFAFKCSRMSWPVRTPASSCRSCWLREGTCAWHLQGSMGEAHRGLWQTALCSRNARAVPCHQQQGC